MKKRIVSAILALVLLISALPMAAVAAETETAPAEIQETIPVDAAVAHNHDYKRKEVAPTCTEYGHVTYTCKYCTESYQDNYIVPLGHEYNEGVCIRCDAKEADEEPVSPESIVAKGTCVGDTEWVLTGDGKLIVSGEGMIPDYPLTGAPWYGWREQIRSVTVEKGVAAIGSYAFYNCANLTKVSMTDSVTAIGSNAFQACPALGTVEISTKLETLGAFAFAECTSLTYFSVPTGVTVISEGAFRGCTALRSVSMSANTTEIGTNAFAGCTQLSLLAMPIKLTTIGVGAFSDCVSLTIVIIPASVKTIGTYAFSGCTGLKNITIPDGVTAVGSSAFSGCTGLTKVSIPKSVTDLEDFLFYDCKGLTKLTLHEDVASVGDAAFAGCTSLEKLYFLGDAPAFDPAVFDRSVDATVYYMKGNKTWTASVKQSYGGNITWAEHSHDYNEDVKKPTCTEKGYTTFTCKDCDYSYVGADTEALGHSFTTYAITTAPTCLEKGVETAKCDRCDATDSRPVDAAGHSFGDYLETKAPTCTAEGELTSKCANCEETRTKASAALGHSYVGTESGALRCVRCDVLSSRIAGTNRCHTSRLVAEAMKGAMGVAQFDAIIYASGDNAADALAGSYLAVTKKAPILLYRAGGAADNLAYIQENLATGGTVYILGGTNTIPGTVDAEMEAAGIKVQRLAGGSRFATNLKILEAAGFSGGEILVCTSEPFADSLSASASGKPILLVNSAWKKLNADYINYLKGKKCTFTIIGGENSVSAELAKDLTKYGKLGGRVSGTNRYLTSIAVADKFTAAPSKAVLAYAQDYPDGLCGGPLAYFLGAPLILTDNNKASVAAQYTTANAIAEGLVLGGTRLISEENADLIFKK